MVLEKTDTHKLFSRLTRLAKPIALARTLFKWQRLLPQPLSSLQVLFSWCRTRMWTRFAQPSMICFHAIASTGTAHFFLRERRCRVVVGRYFLSINGSGFDPVIPSNNLVSFTPESPPPVVGQVISSTRTGLFVEFSELSVENTGLLRANVQTVVLDSDFAAGGCAASVGTCKTSSSTRVAIVTEGGPEILDTPEATYVKDDAFRRGIAYCGFGGNMPKK